MDPAALLTSAVEALRRQDHYAASAVLHRLLSLNPQLGDRWLAVAKIAAAIGEVAISGFAMRCYSDVDPADANRAFARASMLAEAGSLQEAVDIVSPLAVKYPVEAPYHHFLGTVLAQLGENEAAEAHLLHALQIWPQAGITWLTLASLRRLRTTDPMFQRIIAARSSMMAAAPEPKAAYLYALGKAYDDVQEHQLALQAFKAGAELIRPMRPYDAELDKRLALQSLHPSDGGGRADPAAPNRAIFVVGLPRSGTTLVEQMLTSHSRVTDGGEINLLTRALGDARAATKEGGAAALYHHLLDQRFGPEGLIVDKTLSHTRLIGRIGSTFPDAPIVWLRRDPVATAWSCFRTFFNQGLSWSWSPSDIAKHFAAEELLFRHWQEAAGEKLLALSYEELVLDPSRWIPRLLRHCGLDEEEAVYSFHQTRRAITTSSVAQVRRPLDPAATQTAPAYRHHLSEFAREYERLTSSQVARSP